MTTTTPTGAQEAIAPLCIPLSTLRLLWRQALRAWVNDEFTYSDLFRVYVREEIARRTIAELRAELAATQRALEEARAWEPIAEDTVLQENGVRDGWGLYNQSDGVYLCVSTDYGGTELKLPDDMRLCRRVDAPAPQGR
jgi:hypothetical protein